MGYSGAPFGQFGHAPRATPTMKVAADQGHFNHFTLYNIISTSNLLQKMGCTDMSRALRLISSVMVLLIIQGDGVGAIPNIG